MNLKPADRIWYSFYGSPETALILHILQDGDLEVLMNFPEPIQWVAMIPRAWVWTARPPTEAERLCYNRATHQEEPM